MNQHCIEIAKDPAVIAETFPIFRQLRSHLEEEAFSKRVQSQMEQGYRVVYIKEDADIVACMGFRTFEMLAWGKVLYIDDLITCERSRNKGYGSALLSYAIEEAKKLGCDEVHLDTGYMRHDAHRAYLKHGFQLSCHHLGLNLKKAKP